MTSFLPHLFVTDDTVWTIQIVFLPGMSYLLVECGKTVEYNLTSVLKLFLLSIRDIFSLSAHCY